MKRKGFTIAEIVVSMMVLGCIAMVLMPVLVSNTKEQMNATALNKTYSTFQQTARSVGLLISQGKIAQTTPVPTFFEALSHTAKVIPQSKNISYFEKYTHELCTVQNDGSCTLNKGITNIFLPNNDNTTVLKNGVFVTYGTYSGTNYIIVDINGLRPPNKVNDDIFFFTVSNDNASYTVRPASGTCTENDATWSNRIGCVSNKISD